MDRNKIKLSFLLLIAVVPISLATWQFTRMERGGFTSTTNNGTLVNPIKDISEFDLTNADGSMVFRPFAEIMAETSPDEYEPGPWSLLFLGGADCDARCADRLFYLRQAHRLLNEERGRVQRFYVQVDAEPVAFSAPTRLLFSESFPEMKIAFSRESVLLNNLAGSFEQGRNPVAEHFIYVVDPVGNVMLYFTPENSPEEILEDIEHLLDHSSLG